MNESFDVFLSYNSEDKPNVRKLAEALQARDLKVWLDEEQLVPGLPWQEVLEGVIQSIRTAAVLVGKDGLGPWQNSEMRACLSEFVKRDLPVIPVLLPGAPVKPELPLFLRALTWVDLRDGFTKKGLERLKWGITGVRPGEFEIQEHEKVFLSGTVLYAKIRGFSNLSRENRDKAVNFFQKKIEKFFDVFNYGPLGSQRYCYLDFRVNDFLLFIQKENNEYSQDTISRAFVFGLKLQLEKSNQPFDLGITLDWESNARWCKVSNESYLIGPVMDTVQTLMSFSDSGHFFISNIAHEKLELQDQGVVDFMELPGVGNPHLADWWPQALRGKQCICKTFTFYDVGKHRYTLHSLHVQDSNVGNPYIPDYRVAIEYRDKRQASDPKQLFTRHLVEADEVTIIALTHENTVRFLEEALKQRKEFWNRLDIIFPSRSIIEQVIDQRETPMRIQKWQHGKWAVSQFLLNQGSNCVNQWNCNEFNGNLPFIGNRFISRSDKSSIRLSPQLPCSDQKESYYIEVFEGMPVYDKLNNTFDKMLLMSLPINEWNIYGNLNSNNEFEYLGIINRKKIDQVIDYWFPVVLVLLYTNTPTGFKSILQKRTIYNASSDTGTFSNISGRLTDLDVYSAQKLSIKDYGYNQQFPVILEKFLTKINTYFKAFLKSNKKITHIIRYLTPDDDNYIIATNTFNAKTGLKADNLLPDNIWEAAVVRELQEELGLSVKPDRLKYHVSTTLARMDQLKYFFKIYSLEIIQNHRTDELGMIREFRPHAELYARGFTQTELKSMKREGKFNRLLQSKFEEIFLPIFQKLNIEQ